jgi:CheY-like chemotaxis protein
LRLSVRDNGSGIDPADLDKIFDPYFTTKAFGKGTGMGLAVVHGIVKSHNGAIRVDSKVGKGTTVNIYFPPSEDHVEAHHCFENSLPTGNERILIVDDEESIAVLGQRRLEKLGYTVLAETKPIEALERIRAMPDQFDLVITDMAMPVMTGNILVTQIRKIYPAMPVILCTGYSDAIDEVQAKDSGINAFLMKPMETSVLAAAVRKVLDDR